MGYSQHLIKKGGQNQMFKVLRYLPLFLFCMMVAASQALAIGTVTVSTTDYMTVAGVVAVAIGGIWGVKKVIKLLNRS